MTAQPLCQLLPYTPTIGKNQPLATLIPIRSNLLLPLYTRPSRHNHHLPG